MDSFEIFNFYVESNNMENSDINVEIIEALSSSLSSYVLLPLEDLNLHMKWIDSSTCHKSNSEYYKQDRYGNGGAYLVCNSNFNLKIISQDMNATDVMMNLQLAVLSYDVSKGSINKTSGYLHDLDYLHHLKSFSHQ
eukprot:6869187-Ditylum_brightwellii.AAC.1